MFNILLISLLLTKSSIRRIERISQFL